MVGVVDDYIAISGHQPVWVEAGTLRAGGRRERGLPELAVEVSSCLGVAVQVYRPINSI